MAAGAEHLLVLRQLDGCRTVVDIGANRGQPCWVRRSRNPTICEQHADSCWVMPLRA